MSDAIKTTLLEPSPEFEEWVATLDPKHWARHDISACRLGWEAGRAALTAYEAAKGGGAGVKPGATAWENIHNGAIRRVEPNDPENYIALGPITSPANGERDAPSGYVLVPVEPTEDTAELIARLREACNGHPHAKIAWPHRVLHEAADALSSLVRERDEALEAAYDQPHGPTSRILWSTRYRELLDDYKDERTRREAAEADVARMRKALEPFAIEADSWNDMWHDDYVPVLTPTAADDGDNEKAAFTVGDLRRARNALGGKDE